MKKHEKKLRDYEKKINQQVRKEQDKLWSSIAFFVLILLFLIGLIFAIINKFF